MSLGAYDRYILRLEAQTRQYEQSLFAAQRQADVMLGRIERRFAAANKRIKLSPIGMGGMMGGIGAGLGARAIREYADSWTSVTRALEANEQVFGMRLRSAAELNKLANESRIENDALAKLYIRTAAATRDLGASEEDVAKATTTVAKALKLGTAAASEQASVMLQLSQALQKGKLDGDEFRSVMENAGVIQELLAERLKVTKGEIVKMAAAGQLTVEHLFGALVDGAEKVDRIFREMPATIEEAFVVLNNNFEEYIGNLDKAYGTTEAMVSAVMALSNNIEPLADGALVAGGALAAAFAPKLVMGVVGLAAALAAAAGPLGLIAGGLAGGAMYAERFGDTMNFNIDLMRNAIDQGADFSTAWGQAFSDVDKQGVTMQDTFRAVFAVVIEETNRLLEYINTIPLGISISIGEMLSHLKRGINFLVSSVVFARDFVVEVIGSIPSVIAEKVIDAVNWLLRGLQTVLDTTTEWRNNLVAIVNKIPGVEFEFLVADEVGQIENKFAGAGERAGKAFSDAASNFSRDWVGEAGDAIGQYMDGVFDRVSEKARENAIWRQWRTGTTTDRVVPEKEKYSASAEEDKKAAKARRAFERDLLQLENRIALEKQEADLIGRSAFEIEKMRTKQELLNEARKAGIKLTEDDHLKIEALANGMARAVTEAETLRNAYEDMKAESQEFLSGFIRDMKDGASASDALSKALDGIANKLIDMAVQNLVESALGGLTGRGGNAPGSAGGSALLGLFGFSGGGYTGPGGKHQPAGVVHKGEVVWSQDDVARAGGVAAVEAMRRGMAGYANGGAVAVPNVHVPKAAAAPSQAINLTVAPTFNVQNGTPEGVDKMKSEIIPTIRKVVRSEVDEMFSRKARYRDAT